MSRYDPGWDGGNKIVGKKNVMISIDDIHKIACSKVHFCTENKVRCFHFHPRNLL